MWLEPKEASPAPPRRGALMTSQTSSSAPSTLTRILAKRLYDPYTCSILADKEIIVDEVSGLILAVNDLSDLDWENVTSHEDQRDSESQLWYADDLKTAKVIDLREMQLVLPGFVDTHVHLFLHAYSGTSWDDQVTKESETERTIRAVVHAHATLEAGYTTVRDLGTEGAGDADVALRKCISTPLEIVPGPRYFIATRATVATGSYGPKHELRPLQEGVDGVTGSLVADGVYAVRAAVRKQVGAGADWVKVYIDYRKRSLLRHVDPVAAETSKPLWSLPELEAIVDEAHQAGVKVAAHISTDLGLDHARRVKVDSVEHGYEMLQPGHSTNPVRELLGLNPPPETQLGFLGVPGYWSPTLATFEAHGPEVYDMAKKTFRSVLEFNERQQRFPPTSLAAPVRIACGGDTGVFDHGKNAREMVCMVNLGVAPLTVLSWNVLNGWRCVRSLRMEQDIASSSSSSSAAVAEGRSPWHGESPRETEALEMAYAQRFVNAVKVTGRKLTRAELGDNAVPFGAIRPGFAADIIALGGAAGDLEGSPEGFEHSVDGGNVQFVMKGGRVWKAGGVWSGSR